MKLSSQGLSPWENHPVSGKRPDRCSNFEFQDRACTICLMRRPLASGVPRRLEGGLEEWERGGGPQAAAPRSAPLAGSPTLRSAEWLMRKVKKVRLDNTNTGRWRR